MDTKHTASMIASMIAASLLASLRIALERGILTPDNLEHVARAAANNAAMAIDLDLLELDA